MGEKGSNEKNLIENRHIRRASPLLLLLLPHENEKTFQLSTFFLRRVFSRCNKLNVTHIPGACFSITLCFPPVSTTRRLLASDCAHGRLHFHSPFARCVSFSETKKEIIFLTPLKFLVTTSTIVISVFPEKSQFLIQPVTSIFKMIYSEGFLLCNVCQIIHYLNHILSLFYDLKLKHNTASGIIY